MYDSNTINQRIFKNSTLNRPTTDVLCSFCQVIITLALLTIAIITLINCKVFTHIAGQTITAKQCQEGLLIIKLQEDIQCVSICGDKYMQVGQACFPV